MPSNPSGGSIEEREEQLRRERLEFERQKLEAEKHALNSDSAPSFGKIFVTIVKVFFAVLLLVWIIKTICDFLGIRLL